MIEILPSSPRTGQNTNLPSFHVIKLPPVTIDKRQLVLEFCIQPVGTLQQQAIWWTSYAVFARPGFLNKGTGVYTEWNEFGTFASPQMGIMATVTPRTNGIVIGDIGKGVLNGNQTNGTVLRVIDLKGLGAAQGNVDIYAVLVATGMHDGAYQVGGQARLEFTFS